MPNLHRFAAKEVRRKRPEPACVAPLTLIGSAAPPTTASSYATQMPGTASF